MCSFRAFFACFALDILADRPRYLPSVCKFADTASGHRPSTTPIPHAAATTRALHSGRDGVCVQPRPRVPIWLAGLVHDGRAVLASRVRQDAAAAAGHARLAAHLHPRLPARAAADLPAGRLAAAVESRVRRPGRPRLLLQRHADRHVPHRSGPDSARPRTRRHLTRRKDPRRRGDRRARRGARQPVRCRASAHDGGGRRRRCGRLARYRDARRRAAAVGIVARVRRRRCAAGGRGAGAHGARRERVDIARSIADRGAALEL